MSSTLWTVLATCLASMLSTNFADVKITQSVISVPEGSPIQVTCTSQEEDDVEWKHNSVDVEVLRRNDSRYTLSKSQAGVGAMVTDSLHISDARLEDSGEIQCRDINEIFSDYVTVSVSVIRDEANKPRLIIDPPGKILLQRPDSLLNLNCSGEYRSRPTWFLNNQLLNETHDTTITHVLDTVYLRRHVMLTRDGVDNTGTYGCVDDMRSMREAPEVVVTVHEPGTKRGPQQSKPSSNTVSSLPSAPVRWIRKPGSMVKLKCHITRPDMRITNGIFVQKRGEKKPIFSQFHGKGLESLTHTDYQGRLFAMGESVVVIRRLRAQDDGWYRCTDSLGRPTTNLTWTRLIIKADSNTDRSRLPKSRVRRVIGGTSYAEGKWPWLVSLQGKVPDRMLFGIPLSYKHFFCGASLLNERWVMTAAHCFPDNFGSRGTTPKYWHARLGEVGLKRGSIERLKDWIGRVFEVDELRHFYLHATKVILHPQYDKNKIWKNDIALLKLEEDVPSGEDIKPFIRSIDLTAANNFTFPADGQSCFMKGWGCTANGGGVASTAREVVMPKVNDVSCEQFWGIPTVNRLCAGSSSTFNLGLCSGDSGGPLVCHNGVDWVQVGIASFTSATRPEQVPGVFTRVSSYVPWIQDVIAKN